MQGCRLRKLLLLEKVFQNKGRFDSSFLIRKTTD